MSYPSVGNDKSLLLGFNWNSQNKGIDPNVLFYGMGGRRGGSGTSSPDIPDSDLDGLSPDIKDGSDAIETGRSLISSALSMASGDAQAASMLPQYRKGVELLRVSAHDDKRYKEEKSYWDDKSKFYALTQKDASHAYMPDGNVMGFKIDESTGDVLNISELYKLRMDEGQAGRLGVYNKDKDRRNIWGRYGFQNGEPLSHQVISRTAKEANEYLRDIFSTVGSSGWSESPSATNPIATAAGNILEIYKSGGHGKSNKNQLDFAVKNLRESLDAETVGGLFSDFANSSDYNNFRNEVIERDGKITKQQVLDKFSEWMFARIKNIAYEKFTSDKTESFSRVPKGEGGSGAENMGRSSWIAQALSGTGYSPSTTKYGIATINENGVYTNTDLTNSGLAELTGGQDWLTSVVNYHQRNLVKIGQKGDEANYENSKDLLPSFMAFDGERLIQDPVTNGLMINSSNGIGSGISDQYNTNILQNSYIASDAPTTAKMIMDEQSWKNFIFYLKEKAAENGKSSLTVEALREIEKKLPVNGITHSQFHIDQGKSRAGINHAIALLNAYNGSYNLENAPLHFIETVVLTKPQEFSTVWGDPKNRIMFPVSRLKKEWDENDILRTKYKSEGWRSTYGDLAGTTGTDSWVVLDKDKPGFSDIDFDKRDKRKKIHEKYMRESRIAEIDSDFAKESAAIPLRIFIRKEDAHMWDKRLTPASATFLNQAGNAELTR